MEAFVEVKREDGHTETVKITGEQAIVGRSPVANVPLPDMRELELEHLLLAPKKEGCWVAVARGATIPAFVRGQRIDHRMLPWGTEVQLGTVKLKLMDALPRPDKVKAGVNPLLLVATIVIVPVAGWVLLRPKGQDIITEQPAAAAPELFASQAQCPAQGDAAKRRADAASQAADARGQRYPFDAQDGIRAVQQYQVAYACYQTAGELSEAARMQREGGALQRRIEEDYRTHRLRLDRAIEQEQVLDALYETQALLALLKHKQGDQYRAWLETLERRLQLAIDQALKKKK